MSKLEIKNLEELINKCTGKNQRLVRSELSRLTALGENYGSVMIKLDVTLKGTDDSEETLHLVAKCIPESEFFKKAFHVDRTVINESAFYTTVIPALQQFQREHGITDVIDCFPKFYGMRLNLKEDSEDVDDNALLLLENLNYAGYQNIDRHVGFNLDDAKLVLKDLASLHAISIALRLEKPALFEEKIKKYCERFEPPPPPPEGETKIIDICLGIVKDDEECKPYLSKYEKLFKSGNPFGSLKEPTEPFISLSHTDMWSNNTMQKFEEGKAISNKFIDFQMYNCESPARDLTFLLWSSCQFNVLKDHVDELIEYYHQHFIRNLESVNCDTGRFTFDKFLEEMHNVTSEEAKHLTFFILFVIFGKKNEAFKPDELDKMRRHKDEVPEEAKKRLRYMVKYFGKRGWL